jgi:hypothetical protein
VRFIVFGYGSQLLRIEESAFCESLGLKAICLPASVEFIGKACFGECRGVQSITFEFASRLSQIEHTFFYSSALKAINVPASVEELG